MYIVILLVYFSNFVSQGMDQKQIHAYQGSSPLIKKPHINKLKTTQD